jgi:hypothetical protein
VAVSGRELITRANRPDGDEHEGGEGACLDQSDALGAPVRRRVGGDGGHGSHGEGERQYPPTKPGRAAIAFGGQRQEERRGTDGERADEGQVAGHEWEGLGEDADQDGEQERVHGLGDEQVRHPLDVADHPATLGDDRGEGGEVAVEQHELGDGP